MSTTLHMRTIDGRPTPYASARCFLAQAATNLYFARRLTEMVNAAKASKPSISFFSESVCRAMTRDRRARARKAVACNIAAAVLLEKGVLL